MKVKPFLCPLKSRQRSLDLNGRTSDLRAGRQGIVLFCQALLNRKMG